MFSAIVVALKISSWISDIWISYLLIVKAWNRLSWLKIKCNFWNSVIYKLMKLKWLLITTYSYHIKSFHTLVQKMLSHTGWILSHPLDRESVCVCANSSLEREGLLWGPVGSLQVQPPIWPGQIPLLCPSDDISKNHPSRPCSFRGDRCKSFPVFFRLVFY